MEIGITLLIIIGLLYFLLVKGYLWKIIIGIFGVIGMYTFLSSFSSCQTNGLTFGSSNISWAIVIPLVILLLAASTTKV